MELYSIIIILLAIAIGIGLPFIVKHLNFKEKTEE
jgi:hypothetical protein